MSKVLLTGASGYIGMHVTSQFKDNLKLVACYRSLPAISHASFETLKIINIDDLTDWKEVLPEVNVVIHMASVAHISAPSTSFHTVNVNGTLNLAQQASEAGVKRFIFLSSIGVNGASNSTPFTVYDTPNPTEPYAQSKWEAEQGLMQIAERTGMEVVIIRPPLVYGPNAPGNFGRLVRWVEKGIPLPLGAVNNQRTLVGLDNLVDLIRVCIDHPAAASRVILAGDDEDVSTTQILPGIAEGIGKPSRLIPVPESLLWAGASLLGKRAMAEKVLGSLQVDISETKKLLDWEPPYSFAEGMRRCFE